jgi:RHS repeat-associated protein
LDAPLDLFRLDWNGATKLLLPHENWRGAYDAGSDTTGTVLTEWDIQFPASYRNAFHVDPEEPFRDLRDWFGSLIQDKADESGLIYMRNRYYDPATGKFTQEDPIGLAGGLNLYGFAGGDPINFSDPFGLCEEEERDENGECPDANRYSIGAQGLVGGGPLFPSFLSPGGFGGGGMNFGVTSDGRLFLQFQASLGAGVGWFAGVGLQASVERGDELEGRLTVEDQFSVTVNGGLGPASAGVTVPFGEDGAPSGVSAGGGVRGGVGLGAQSSVQRVRTTTLATPRLPLLRWIVGLFGGK